MSRQYYSIVIVDNAVCSCLTIVIVDNIVVSIVIGDNVITLPSTTVGATVLITLYLKVQVGYFNEAD